jgi:selenocysteine lyase/cysteine desulfurase
LSLDVADRFADASGYLNTASFGLPPDTAWAAFTAAAEGWRDGRAQPQDYDATITRARAVFARLLHVPESWVAVGHQASPMIGLVAASLPDGAEVVVADGQFTSTLFPFLAQERRGIEVRSVPFDRVADAVTARTSLVAVEAVRSDSGAVADLAQIRAAARDNDARVLADTTQATGWLDIDASGLDYVVCSAYKWLLSPRGTAFMSVSPEAAETLIPHAAGWYAGDDVWDSIYGAPLRLAETARRFDISPAWLMWVGTLPALELLEEIGIARVGAHGVGLANRLRGHLGLPPAESPIVSVAVDGASDRLAAAGITAAVRAGAARLSFHLYNSETDADRAAEALAGVATRRA